ncbi:MAG: sulfur oxidation c-type cytochrome SoxA, partial [Pseudomonadota bacterium]|nr:sulfur oxidation c-type cytochrome SoxA [Pseudomonadota bacterium]
MMGRRLAMGIVALCLGALLTARAAERIDPEADRVAFQAYFKDRFPGVPLAEYANGPYAVNKEMRKQWEDIMQFPPYDFALDEGKQLFETPFANGKTYADCFPNKGIGIRQTYPEFDPTSGKIITLDLAINQCRAQNGEKPLPYQIGQIASIAAYMASTSRGKPFEIAIPNDPRALAAYEDGKKAFYKRGGQLNFSCASCHVQSAGDR